MTPSVSVVLPTFNRATTLPRSISSVLAQSFDDLELIVVDDGSTDATGDAVAAFEDDRVRFLRLRARGGANAARNHGLAAARADLIAFQDSDACWLPQKLERQVRALEEHPFVDVCFCRARRPRPDGTVEIVPPIGWRVPGHDEMLGSLVRANVIDLPAVVVRQEIFAARRFDERLPRFQDWDLWLSLAESGRRFGFVDEELVVSPIGTDSITADDELLLGGLEAILRKHRPSFRREPGELARRRRELQLAALRRRHYLQAARHVLRGAVEDPASVARFAWARVRRRVARGQTRP